MVTLDTVVDRDVLAYFNARLASWRIDRRLTEVMQRSNYVNNFLQEIKEFKQATSIEHKIEELCDMIIISWNCYNFDEAYLQIIASRFNYKIIHHERYVLPSKMLIKTCKATITDVIASVLAEIYQLGYHPLVALEEKINVITSRTGKWSEQEQKWIKDDTPEAKEKWYKPDYRKAICDIYKDTAILEYANDKWQEYQDYMANTENVDIVQQAIAVAAQYGPDSRNDN